MPEGSKAAKVIDLIIAYPLTYILGMVDLIAVTVLSLVVLTVIPLLGLVVMGIFSYHLDDLRCLIRIL